MKRSLAASGERRVHEPGPTAQSTVQFKAGVLLQKPLANGDRKAGFCSGQHIGRQGFSWCVRHGLLIKAWMREQERGDAAEQVRVHEGSADLERVVHAGPISV